MEETQAVAPITDVVHESPQPTEVVYEPPQLITVEIPAEAEIFNICDSLCA